MVREPEVTKGWAIIVASCLVGVPWSIQSGMWHFGMESMACSWAEVGETAAYAGPAERVAEEGHIEWVDWGEDIDRVATVVQVVHMEQVEETERAEELVRTEHSERAERAVRIEETETTARVDRSEFAVAVVRVAHFDLDVEVVRAVQLEKVAAGTEVAAAEATFDAPW